MRRLLADNDWFTLTMNEKSYLRFDESLSSSGKTKIVFIYSVHSGDCLGHISWFGHWRCYTLQPEPGTVWNTGCLTEVQEKILSLTQERITTP